MRVYTVIFNKVTITTAGTDQDLFMFAPVANKPIVLLAAEIYNAGIAADAGDAQEEFLPITIIRGLATVGSGGTAPTPQAICENDTAASFTARVNDTTIAVVGAGTTEILYAGCLPTRPGIDKPLTEQQWLRCTAAKTRMVIRLDGTVTDDIVMSGTAWVGEEN